MAVVGSIRRTPWGRPLPVSAGVSSAPARTYAEFQTHIQGLATNGSSSWDATNLSGGKRIVQALSTYSGNMTGSSWGPSSSEGFAVSSSYIGQILRHAFPSEAAIDEQRANSGQIYIEVSSSTANTEFLPSVTRNGYTSIAYNSTGAGCRKIIDLIRWDFTLNKAFRSNPSSGTAETEYTW